MTALGDFDAGSIRSANGSVPNF
jgi:hypothetical protein